VIPHRVGGAAWRRQRRRRSSVPSAAMALRRSLMARGSPAAPHEEGDGERRFDWKKSRAIAALTVEGGKRCGGSGDLASPGEGRRSPMPWRGQLGADPLQSRAATATWGQPRRGPAHSDPLQRAVTAEELAPDQDGEAAGAVGTVGELPRRKRKVRAASAAFMPESSRYHAEKEGRRGPGRAARGTRICLACAVEGARLQRRVRA
jgi:hypothetical protein